MDDLPFDFDDLDEVDYCKVLDLYAGYDAEDELPPEDESYDRWLSWMI